MHHPHALPFSTPQEEASALVKSSFAFAFYMDRQKEERERGVTISCTTKEFFTNTFHYTIIDAPGGWVGRGRGGWEMEAGCCQCCAALVLPPCEPASSGSNTCRLRPAC